MNKACGMVRNMDKWNRTIQFGYARFKLWHIPALLFFSLVYVYAVNRVLLPSYYVYTARIIDYNKAFSPEKMLVALVLVVLMFFATMCVNTENLILNGVIRTLFYIYCAPMLLSYCLFEGESYERMIFLFVIYWTVLCFTGAFLSFALPKFGIKIFNNRKYERYVMAGLFLLMLAYLILKMPSFSLSLSIDNVYETREAYKKNASDLTTFFKSTLGTYICPAMIAFLFRRRKYVFGAGFCVFQVALYSMANDKFYLLMLAAGIAIGLSGFIKEFETYLYLAVVGISLCNLAAVHGYLVNFIFNIFVRRFFILPAWLNYLYVSFFSHREVIGWSQDTFLIDRFFSDTYPMSVPGLISARFFKGQVANPNAGMLAEAYSRFGFAGLFIYPLLLVMLIGMIGYFYRETPDEVKYVISIALAVALGNDVITSTSFVFIILIVIVFSLLLRADTKTRRRTVRGRKGKNFEKDNTHNQPVLCTGKYHSIHKIYKDRKVSAGYRQLQICGNNKKLRRQEGSSSRKGS